MLRFKQHFETVHGFKGEIRIVHVMFKALVVIRNWKRAISTSDSSTFLGTFSILHLLGKTNDLPGWQFANDFTISAENLSPGFAQRM